MKLQAQQPDRADAGGRYALPELLTVEPELTETSSLAEKAYYLIRDRIISLRLAPGVTVNERALMHQLGLGRTPIREALRRLADEKLVDVAPRRGMFVTHIDIRDLESIAEVRVEIEGHAARLAARRATAPEREEAGRLLAWLDERHAVADQTELMRFDQRIHRHVHRCTHNRYLTATLEEYFVLSLRLWFLVLDRITRLEQAITEHRDLLAAIRDGDPERAEAVLRDHVTGFEQEIRRVL
ncbi:MAG: GntR family transcriptional regulator [Egibacteraceae bacterium]